MFKFLKKNKEAFRNIGNGTVVELKDVPDGVFSEKMMGDGYALDLSEGTVYAPVSGEVTMVFPTGHAYGMTTEDGVEILIHIGLDTVELNGEGFKGQVPAGTKVKQGDVLTHVDLDFIRSKGKSLITPVIFTSGQTISLHKKGEVVDQNTEGIFTFN